jgi:hypothetical protein
MYEVSVTATVNAASPYPKSRVRIVSKSDAVAAILAKPKRFNEIRKSFRRLLSRQQTKTEEKVDVGRRKVFPLPVTLTLTYQAEKASDMVGPARVTISTSRCETPKTSQLAGMVI